jgi:hypothetical protein
VGFRLRSERANFACHMGLSAVGILHETSTSVFRASNLEGRPVASSGLKKESNAGISISWPPAGVRLHSLSFEAWFPWKQR